MEIFQVTLIVATFLCTLVAGFVFAFAVVVMPGIRTLGDCEFLRAFQVRIRSVRSNSDASLRTESAPQLRTYVRDAKIRTAAFRRIRSLVFPNTPDRIDLRGPFGPPRSSRRSANGPLRGFTHPRLGSNQSHESAPGPNRERPRGNRVPWGTLQYARQDSNL